MNLKPPNRTSRSQRVPFFANVTFRLTLWYILKMGCILLLFVISSYSTLSSLGLEAGDARLEASLSEKARQLADAYRPALAANHSSLVSQINLAPGEVIVVVLRLDGTLLDTRGPLTGEAVRQLQSQAANSAPFINLTLPLNKGHSPEITNEEYRLLITPLLDQNTRLANLMIGLPRQSQTPPGFWLWRALVVLLIAALGGYLLAGIAMRPVAKITRLAQEINATDLRRRLNLKRRDEFGLLAATFDQMLARLEAAFQRQTQFTADASHELRTPLTIVGLEINRALTQCQTSQEYRQVLEQIQAENEQMASIVNHLLLLARADTGKLELHLEKVDLSDIALGCVERMVPLAKEKQILLSTGSLPELLVWGDQLQLRRMVMSLLENAIKYTSGVGKRVRVELSGEQAGWALLRVEDDGPGIAPEHLPFLFERFYRADKARRQLAGYHNGETPGGTGLGLAIVQAIVLSHGGAVRVESKLGSGSLFEVSLPLADGPSPILETEPVKGKMTL